MSPIRIVDVAINWILFIAFVASLITFIVGCVSHNKKLKKYSGICCVVLVVLLVIAFAISVHLERMGVE